MKQMSQNSIITNGLAKILVDADALPKAARDIIFRAAVRVRIKTIFVANRYIHVPEHECMSLQITEETPDAADDLICELIQAGDVVISADIPLAARVVAKGAIAIDPRGQLFDPNNIKERLFMRDFMDTLRQSGAITGGPAPYGKKEAREFASLLDRTLAKLLR